MSLIAWLLAPLLLKRLSQPERPKGLVETRSLSPIQEFGYAYARQLLTLAIEQGLLRPSAIKTACDFGAGTGGPTLALREVLRVPDRHLTLLEADLQQRKSLRQLFPNSRHESGNGLGWLAAREHPQDFITAFMLGPDYDGDGLAFSLIHNALACLTPGGTLLICSDTATMIAVRQVLAELSGVHCHWLAQADSDLLPVTVLVSKAEKPGPSSARALPGISVPERPLSGPSLSGPPDYKLHFSEIPEFPRPVRKTVSLPDRNGRQDVEEYCVSTRFERAYLQATIETFELSQPRHPALPHLRQFLKDCERPDGGLPAEKTFSKDITDLGIT